MILSRCSVPSSHAKLPYHPFQVTRVHLSHHALAALLHQHVIGARQITNVIQLVVLMVVFMVSAVMIIKVSIASSSIIVLPPASIITQWTLSAIILPVDLSLSLCVCLFGFLHTYHSKNIRVTPLNHCLPPYITACVRKEPQPAGHKPPSMAILIGLGVFLISCLACTGACYWFVHLYIDHSTIIKMEKDSTYQELVVSE